MNKSIKNIGRNLKLHIKYVILLITAGALSIGVLSSYISLTDTSRISDVYTAQSLYGNYHYSVYGVSDDNLPLIDTNYTRSTCCVDIYYGAADGKYISLYGINEDNLQNTEYRLIEGNFPKSKNEILVEKWFAIQCGLTPEKIIGSRINIDIGYETVNMTVSGIINNMSTFGVMEGDNQNAILIVNSKYSSDFSDSTMNNVYILSDDVARMGEILPELCIETSADGFSYNSELLAAENTLADSGLSYYKKNPAFFLAVAAIFLYIIITVNCVADICFSNWNRELTILKAIGAPARHMLVPVCIKLNGLIMIGMLVGGITGYTAVYMANKLSLSVMLSINVPFAAKSISLIACIILLINLILICMTLHKFTPLGRLSVCELKSFTNKIYSQSVNNKSRSSMFKKKGDLFDLAMRNLSFYKWRKILIALCISLSALITCLAGSFLIQQNAYNTSNLEYDYRIKVKDYFKAAEYNQDDSIRAAYKELEKILDDENITVYYDASLLIEDFHMDKSWLTDEYTAYIRNTADGISSLNNGRNYIMTPLIVLGYSDDMIQELAIKNNLNITRLNDDEIIFCRNTFDEYGVTNYTLNPQRGSEITCVSSVLSFIESVDENGEVQYYARPITYAGTIADITDSVLVQPEYNGNYPCIIVNMNTFNKCFMFNDYVSDLYIRTLTPSAYSRLSYLFEGTDYFQLISQQEIYEQTVIAQKQSIFICASIFLFCCVLTTINLIMLSCYELDIRKSEYNMLYKLGASSSRILASIIYEVLVIYGIGIISGIGVSQCIIAITNALDVIDIEFIPLPIIFISILCFICSIALSIFFIRKKLSAITGVQNA